MFYEQRATSFKRGTPADLLIQMHNDYIITVRPFGFIIVRYYFHFSGLCTPQLGRLDNRCAT